MARLNFALFLTFAGVPALLGISPAFGQATDPSAFFALERDSFKILSYDECKASYFNVDFGPLLSASAATGASRKMTLAADGWIPRGNPEKLEPLGCGPEDLERLYISERANPIEQAKNLQRWFNKCDAGLGTELAAGDFAGPRALAHAGSLRYAFCDNPNIRKVVIRLANGDTVRAVLGIKPGWSPRPLVIAKCGMLCNAGDAGMQLLLMHLFDESPFNVLVVGNNTGADYIRDNGVFIPGGFAEGQQIIRLAKLLRESPLSPFITSTHVVGLSLGGHASLYAAYLNGFNSPSGEPPLIASTFAACPAVDLRAAIEDNFSIDLKGFAIGSLYNQAIDRVLETHPHLAGLFKWNQEPRSWRTDLVGDQAVEGLRRLPRGPWLAPFEAKVVRDRRDFWALNQFSNFAKAPLATPTLAVAAADDEVVLPLRNIKTLDRTPLARAITPRGDHCVWSEFYGWRISSAMFRGYVVSQSPDLLQSRKLERISLPPDLKSTVGPIRGRRLLTSFSFAAGQDGLKVNHLIDTTECGAANPAPCRRDVSFIVPFSSWEKRPWWARAPLNPTEAEALTRWANVNLRMIGANGFQVDGSTNDGTELVWVGYGEEG